MRRDGTGSCPWPACAGSTVGSGSTPRRGTVSRRVPPPSVHRAPMRGAFPAPMCHLDQLRERQRLRPDRVEQASDLPRARDRLHAEQRLGVVAPACLLYPTLVVQQRRTLQKRHREDAQRRVADLLALVVPGPCAVPRGHNNASRTKWRSARPPRSCSQHRST